MAPDDSSPPTRGQTRVPIDAEVQLEFENFSGFIREVSANLSLGGMFVKTRYLKPVGTVVRFEFRLSDQYRLIRGTGEVVWTRWRDQPPAMPAGMGIQFLDLEAESRTLVTAIVEQHQRAGGAPFDLAMRSHAEDPEPPPSFGGAFADALPAAAGAAMTADSVSEWLQTEPRLTGPTTVSPREDGDRPIQASLVHDHEAAREQVAISFEEPPELPAAPPTAAPAAPALPWVSESRGTSVSPARQLDWGAAEAMAALGIAPSVPVAAAAPPPPPSPDDTLIPPEFPPVAARPMFSGGHAASESEGGRWALRIAIPLLVIALGGAGWWFLQERFKTKPSTVELVEGPSSARPPAPAARPVVPAPAPAAKSPTAADAARPDNAPLRPAPVNPATVAAVPAPPVAVTPEPARAPGAVNFDAVSKITFQSAGGETEVVLWTNGVVRAEDVEHLRLDDPEPREVLKLRGVVEAFSPSKLTVGSGELRQIRVGFHEQRPRGQLHVVFDLAAHDVRIVSMRADGAQLKVRFGRE